MKKLDWVFDIPDIYLNCYMAPADCKANGYQLSHAFNHFVNATSRVNVVCTKGKRADGLPDWVWSVDGIEFQNYMASCFDPTYCLTDPPVPIYNNTNYVTPVLGSLKFGDGEQVTYSCKNPGKDDIFF